MDCISNKVGGYMIEFKFVSNSPLPLVFPQQYPDVLKFEGYFSIEIDGYIYFSEPNFSIFEFLLYAKNWLLTKKQDLLYNSIDTEDNPLISLLCFNNRWAIHSPWENFSCQRLFSREELEYSINNLIKKMGYNI